MFKRFVIKQMMKKQLAALPPQQQEMILDAIEKNPDFFKMINQEVEVLKKQGKDQTTASLEVMRKHQKELQDIMMGKV